MKSQKFLVGAIVRSLFICIIGLLFITALPLQAAQFQTDGTIVGSAGRISLDPNGDIHLSNDQGDAYDIHLSMGMPSKPWFNGGGLEKKSLQVDIAKQTATFRGEITPPGAERVTVELSLALISANRARINLQFDKTSLGGLAVHLSRPCLEGHTIQVDKTSCLVAANQPPSAHGQPLFRGNPSEIVYFADDAQRRISFHMLKAKVVELVDSNVTAHSPWVEMRLPPENNQVAFDVDMGKVEAGSASGETYAGVDFFAADKLKMPQYSLCRNLMQNPGFEEGLRYWRLSSGLMTQLGEHYSIDTKEAQNGRQCLKIIAETGQYPSLIATFGIPVKTGTKYTLSFYAKADRPNLALGMQHVTAVWGKFVSEADWSLTTQWKRYSLSFTAPNNLFSPSFGARKPSTDGNIWLDAFQLEEGPMTDYVEPPAGVQLLTAHRGNLFEPNEPVKGSLEIHAPVGTKGQVQLRLTDFFDQAVHEEKREFTTNEHGLAKLSLEWMTGLPVGLYVLETNLQLADGFAKRDFDRLAVMPSLANVALRHDLVAMQAGENDNWQRAIDRWQRLGVTRMINFSSAPNHAYVNEALKHGITTLCTIFPGNWGEISGTKNLKHDFHCTPEELKTVEENAYKRISEYPEIPYWKLVNEPDTNAWNKPEEAKRFIEPLLAARRGVLRANPKALISSPDPANMYISAIRSFSKFLDAGGGETSDIMAIHPYRPRPEEPDLDADIASMIAMLNDHHYKGELWFTEGIYHQNYLLPAYGLDVHKGCTSDGNRTGDFSYHMGWGEKICAAYTARSFIIAHKYANRVKMFVDWGLAKNTTLDVDLTPAASAFVPNTIGQLLGNADYRSDVILGEGVRGYMFEDDHHQPVAVLWTTSLDIDAGRKQGPALDLTTLPKDVQIIDLMGKSIARENLKQCRLSPFPLFFRGKPGTIAALTQTMSHMELSAEDVSPVRTVLRAVSPTQVELSVHNRLVRPVEGQLRVWLNDKLLFDDATTIPLKEAWKKTITLPSSSEPIRKNTFATEFSPRGRTERAMSKESLEIMTCPHTAKPINLDGELSDWPAQSAIPLPPHFMEFEPPSKENYPNGMPWKGAADLSATLYSAWDEQYFYLAVSVRDDVFHPSDSPDDSWNGDGIQIYFDGWADARQHTSKGYDNNDQVYSVWPGPKGIQIKRDVAPEQQLAFLKTGLVPEVRSVFKRTADGYVIKLAFPIAQIAPIQLKDGSVFGFALIINDNDGDYRKRGLSLTPAGTEPYMRPDLYPSMILKK